jgi:hypothetical protein
LQKIPENDFGPPAIKNKKRVFFTLFYGMMKGIPHTIRVRGIEKEKDERT